MKLVWSETYDVDLFGHVFPAVKYKLIKEAILSEGLARPEDLVAACPAAREDLLLVHTPAYLDDLLSLRWTERTMRSEMALTREIMEAFLFTAGGTVTAAGLALDERVCVHIGGGYHHAYPDHAEGFCYLNDVAVGVASLLGRKRIARACVIDCDLHQGNGTASIFAARPEVFTFSIHQENNYPPKERSDLDVGLPDGAGDEIYLRELEAVGEVLDKHRPDLCLYLAGADPFEGDLLGGLAITKDGLRRRDALVLEQCRARRVPVCVVLAGGYAPDVSDVVEIHVNTVREARRIFG